MHAHTHMHTCVWSHTHTHISRNWVYKKIQQHTKKKTWHLRTKEEHFQTNAQRETCNVQKTQLCVLNKIQENMILLKQEMKDEMIGWPIDVKMQTD